MDRTNEVLQFRNSFIDEVNARAAANEDFKRTAFATVFTEYLADLGVLLDFEPLQYRREGQAFVKKIEIDGYSINSFEETINLVICDYTQQVEPETMTKTDSMQLFSELKAFIVESLNNKLKKEIDISEPAYEFCNILASSKDRTRKYKLFLLTDKIMSKVIGNIPPEMINDIPVDFHVWTIDRLYDSVNDGHESNIIDFSMYGGGVPCVQIKGVAFTSYLCSIPGEILASLYDRLDTSLLEGNIRSFLSTKVAVNSGIRKTIINEPEKFFVFNNGISATASNIEIKNKNGQPYIESIYDLQIVNGGQTTASLSNARFKDKADLTDISVAMKVTVVEKDVSKEIIPRIAEYANTQNKVNSADFFSNHEFCIKMERCSRMCKVPATSGAQYETFWFFERAKGQYIQAQMRKTPSQIKTFQLQNPKERLFTKTDLAKYRQSWDCLPHIVSKGAQTNFQDFANKTQESYESHKEEYNEAYYKETVVLGLLFKTCERIVSKQDWYQQGYRAQIVTYSIALLSKLLKEQFPKYTLDFDRLWREQQLPVEQGVPTCIISELTHITKIINDIITDEDRETANVTQWCKRQKCWDKVLHVNTYRLSNKILDYCIDNSDRTQEIRAAKKEEKLVNESEMITAVYQYGANNWGRLMQFVYDKRFNVSPSQLDALKIAIKMPTKIPNGIQAKVLLELLQHALNNGYKK